MTCPSCGSAIAPGSALCAACGASASPFAETAVTEVEVTATGPVVTAETPRVYANRFRLIEMVGKGGMGEVWRARDTTLGEDVAVKILPPFRPDEPDVERFKREIITARRISHPNVMRVFEFGTHEKGGFISMELLAGGTLADRIANGPIPIPDAVRISLAVADGLVAAHEAGIVHRDVKPQNVLFDDSGRPKLADFGLARLSDATATTVGFSGTPQYMSPEMADGRELTTKSDVYSLGILLFEIFTGRRPFSADTLVRMVMLHQQEAPPSPRAFRPDLPEAIEQVILSALEKEPTARPSSEDLRNALRAASEGMPLPRIAPKPAVSVRAPVSLDAYTIDPRTQPSAPKSRKPKTRTMYALGTALGVLCVLAAYPFIRSRETAAPTPAPTPLAIATAPATAVASATATSTATPHVATPTPTALVKVISTPRPTPAPTKRPAVAGSGTLLVRSFPWVKVVVDGVVVDEQTPMQPRKLEAGTHRVVLSNPAHKFTRSLTVQVEAGKQTTVVADPAAGTARVDATR